MEKLFSLTIIFTFLLFSCGTDAVIDPAGSCVTCTNNNTTIVACADGEGNITVTTTDASGNATAVTSENNLDDFQITQEGSGSTCN